MDEAPPPAAGEQPKAQAAGSNRRFSPNLNNRMKPEDLPAADVAPANARAGGKDFRKFQRQRTPVKADEDASNSYGIMPHYVPAERVTKASSSAGSAHAGGGGGGVGGGAWGVGGVGGAGGVGGVGSKLGSGVGGGVANAKANKASKALNRLSSSVASNFLSNILNDTAPVALPLRQQPPSVEIYSDPFCVPVPTPESAAEPTAVSSAFGSEDKMFFIQLPRTFPALPSDFSMSPSERPFYNNITQMSSTGSRFHVDPPPVAATAASFSAAADIKPILPIEARSSASGLLIPPPTEESVVVKDEGDSSDDMAAAHKAATLFDQPPPAGSCTFTAPAFDILDTREDHVSDKFRNSGQMGTMRFWKSGRVTMMVGGIEFDVSRGAESSFLQQVNHVLHARVLTPCCGL